MTYRKDERFKELPICYLYEDDEFIFNGYRWIIDWVERTDSGKEIRHARRLYDDHERTFAFPGTKVYC